MKEESINLRKILSANVKKHRDLLGLTQEKLAEKAGISANMVNDIEGRRTWVSDKTLENLADALNIDTFQLLLPIQETEQKPINSTEAVKRLLKIKRTYDDSFNEIVNLAEKSGK